MPRRFIGRLVVPALLACALAPAGGHAQPLTVETVALFDASRLEAPESVAVDHRGNLYISLALTGEIRKIAPDGSQSTLALLPVGPPLSPCGPFIGIMGGLALDPNGNVYANLAACDPDNRGVWRITPAGVASRLVPLPPAALPNGLVYRAGALYIADSSLSVIWRAPADGSGPAEVWSHDPLLALSPTPIFPGPNGLQLFRNELYVSVADTGVIAAIPFGPQGEAGPGRLHAHAACDDFAFDVTGALYCGTDPFGTLLRVAPDGSVTVLLTVADGLDGPTAAAFGRTAGGRDVLYVANAAFPFFSATHRPSLLRVDLGIPGLPR